VLFKGTKDKLHSSFLSDNQILFCLGSNILPNSVVKHYLSRHDESLWCLWIGEVLQQPGLSLAVSSPFICFLVHKWLSYSWFEYVK